MPTISRFRNMKVQMYFEDHNPPHFHVRYAKLDCACLLNGALYLGTLPTVKRAEIIEWALLHREELETNWQLCSERQLPNPIPGLD